MANKRPKPEEIITKLRQVEVLMGQFSVKIYLPTGSVLNGNQHCSCKKMPWVLRVALNAKSSNRRGPNFKCCSVQVGTVYAKQFRK